MRKSAFITVALCIMLLTAASAFAQDTILTSDAVATYPAEYHLSGTQHIWQGWNNCGPATLTMGLTYFGYQPDQYIAAQWLKPNGEDKNVSPWQMAEFVNTQTAGTTLALVRGGGTLDRLKVLVSNGFPVLIEAGYDPESDDQGWMGHYLLIIGYDDATQTLYTNDSFLGANKAYSYEHVDFFWQHFNRVYIVLYDIQLEVTMLDLLGDDADERQNSINALEQARAEAIANNNDAHAWFNMGTNFVNLGMYEEAAVAYDQARNIGLPWRMLWYQFGPFEAYYHMERYQDMIALAQQNLNDGGGQYVEETFYYAGLAREGMGELDKALDNYNQAAWFNPNFTPAVEARDRLQGS